MAIQFACPHCGRGFRGPNHYRGVFTVCPACRQHLQIPLELPVMADEPHASRESTAHAAPARPAPHHPSVPLPELVPYTQPPAEQPPPTAPPPPTAASSPLAIASSPSPPPAVSPHYEPPAGEPPRRTKPISEATREVHNAEFHRYMVPLVHSAFPDGPSVLIRGRNLTFSQAQASVAGLVPPTTADEVLAVTCDTRQPPSGPALVITTHHVYSREPHGVQSIALDAVRAATLRFHAVELQLISDDMVFVGEDLADLRPRLAILFQEVARLNAHFPRARPPAWSDWPFPIDSLLLGLWIPQPGAMAILRCDVGIPSKALRGALSTYGDGVQPHEVLAMLDDSHAGTGKVGWFFTRQRLHFPSYAAGLPAGSVPYWRIRTARSGPASSQAQLEIELDSGRRVHLRHASQPSVAAVAAQLFAEMGRTAETLLRNLAT